LWGLQEGCEVEAGAGEEAAEEARPVLHPLEPGLAASTSFVLALALRAVHVDPATAPALTGSYPGS
jgi:hypothetical protein